MDNKGLEARQSHEARRCVAWISTYSVDYHVTSGAVLTRLMPLGPLQ
jgi:hypothetical protein